ncbi:hypothetical protein I7I48_04343 [Histoplasma ohiense]|nr:hypothetical protein I7I48_04343 [Histoplasma ohiense (nom. inval.)]
MVKRYGIFGSHHCTPAHLKPLLSAAPRPSPLVWLQVEPSALVALLLQSHCLRGLQMLSICSLLTLSMIDGLKMT